MKAIFSFSQSQRHNRERKLQIELICLINTDAKILNRILAYGVQQHTGMAFTQTKLDTYLTCRDGSTCKPINVIKHINKLKTKHHVIVSIDAEKAFKIQYHYMLKTLGKLGMEGIFYSTIKAMYERLNASTVLNG